MVIKLFKNFCLITAILSVPLSVLADNVTNSSLPKSSVIASTETANIYTIDQDHSKVTFEVAHLVVSTVTGEFKKFKGNFKFNPEDFSQTQLDASADVNSVDTSVKKRDEHLKSPDFFDAKKFPKMTFKSTSASKTSDKTFDLTGDLTIRGVTKQVTFKVDYRGQIKTKGKITEAFKGSTEINRKDFGVNFQTIVEAGPVVGETVTINISCEGYRNL